MAATPIYKSICPYPRCYYNRAQIARDRWNAIFAEEYRKGATKMQEEEEQESDDIKKWEFNSYIVLLMYWKYICMYHSALINLNEEYVGNSTLPRSRQHFFALFRLVFWGRELKNNEISFILTRITIITIISLANKERIFDLGSMWTI